MYANRIGWTDIDPFEVIRTISDKCLEIREMSAKIDPTWKPQILPGGFAGHCVNNREQRSIITSDPNGRVLRIRLHKNGQWKDAHGSRYNLRDKPKYFYDYNF